MNEREGGMNRRRVMAGMAAGTLVVLAGCGGPAYTWRYKLTLEVDTPDGVKSGFNVVEIAQGASWYEHTIGTAATGEALFLDLGTGRSPLIALLTGTTRDGANRYVFTGMGAMSRRAGVKLEWTKGRNEGLARAISRRDEVEIGPADLPDLVTFGDMADPRTVRKIDPTDLEATLGPGVKWRRMTIAIVSPGAAFGIGGEPITTGIEKRLGWLVGFNGSLAHPGRKGGIRTSNELAATLGLYDFKQGSK